ALKQNTGGESRDGMDVSLCVFHNATGLIHYAGANRPLWVVSGETLNEIRPDKIAIGGVQEETTRTFTHHEIQLRTGDCVYLSSDGYGDQFGGPKGKKFMVKQLQKLLLSIHGESMENQRRILDTNFSEWKGTHEQVDDVLVMGFRYIS
ncbi:MAG TPA: SpoIIE family protein phosphatase, partial [Bacteroidia bacterium]|nr:SpoIIE family protein phosphatase [Bacteroidia bacterium]